MPSKRFKNLPEKTKDISAEAFEKLIPELKKIVLQNLMSL
jgi:large subunit ribosomal protein L1